MSRRFLVLMFDRPGRNGGFGDRINGIANAQILAHLLNREFRIHWFFPSVSDLIKVAVSDVDLDADAELLSKKEDASEVIYLDYLDKWDLLASHWHSGYLQSLPQCFVLIKLNFYIIEKFGLDFQTFGRAILENYRNLYQNILIPEAVLTQQLVPFVNRKRPCIGVQIRTGDVSMNAGTFQAITSTDQLHSVIKTIQAFINQNFVLAEYDLFFTSDMDSAFAIFATYFPTTDILYINRPATHMDLKPQLELLDKVFLDHIILSQVEVPIVSSRSQLGRTAGLINPNPLFGIMKMNDDGYAIQKMDKTRMVIGAE